MDSIFTAADVISEYSRAQAVADGVLVDINNLTDEQRRAVGTKGAFVPMRIHQLVREHFPRIGASERETPICLTVGLWSLIRQAVDHPQWGNDWVGVLHDIFFMSRPAVGRASQRVAAELGQGAEYAAESEWFTVIITGTGRVRNHRLKVVVEPGADGKCWLTYMLGDED